MARNLGIQMAKGNFFAHLDGDDLWEKEKLAMQKEVFAADSAMDIVGTYMESFLSPELAQNTKMTLYCPASQTPAFSATGNSRRMASRARCSQMSLGTGSKSSTHPA